MFEDFLKRLKEEGWTQAEIAQKTGLTQSFISKLYNSDKGCSIETAIALADAFGATLDEIVGRTPSKRAPEVQPRKPKRPKTNCYGKNI